MKFIQIKFILSGCLEFQKNNKQNDDGGPYKKYYINLSAFNLEK